MAGGRCSTISAISHRPAAWTNQALVSTPTTVTHETPAEQTRGTMPTVLSIHLGPTLAHAAVDSDGRIDLLALGERTAHMPVVLHVSTDGTVSVGSEAQQMSRNEPDGTIDNVVGRLLESDNLEVSGRVLTAETIIAHLLAHAYSRCVVVLDRVPDEVLVVLTAGGPEAAVYAAAAERARLGEVTLVDETRSWAAMSAHGPGDLDPDLAGALGALFWKRHGDGPPAPKPIVTREDLGVVSREPARIPTEPSVMSIGPRSVFQEPSVPDMGDRRLRPGLLVAVVVLGGLALAGWFLFPWGDGTGPEPVPDPVAATTVAPIESTTTAPVTTTSTAPPVTAPTAAPAPTTVPGVLVSTTLPAAVTTTTDVPETTTTVQVATTTTRPPLGVLTLSSAGVVTNAATGAETLLGLGDSADVVVAVLTTLMGNPGTDTGWVVDDRCLGDLVRRATFGGLEVVLGDEDATDGEPGTAATFTQWFAGGDDASQTSLWTFDRVGVGSSVADLGEIHGDGLSISNPVDGDTAGLFSIDALGVSDGMRGVTSHISENGRVLQIWAGDGCSRWPD